MYKKKKKKCLSHLCSITVCCIPNNIKAELQQFSHFVLSYYELSAMRSMPHYKPLEVHLSLYSQDSDKKAAVCRIAESQVPVQASGLWPPLSAENMSQECRTNCTSVSHGRSMAKKGFGHTSPLRLSFHFREIT